MSDSAVELEALYRETILRHAKEPVGRGHVPEETHRSEQFNPLCGDRIVLSLHVQNDLILHAGFEGEACAICIASASLLCEQAPGSTVLDMQATHSWLNSSMTGEPDSGQHDQLLPLLAVRRYPSRIRCALLPWEALEDAL
jgi:nitrogen fixation NifU-like protein